MMVSYSLAVGVETGVSEGLSLVFAEEPRVLESDVVDLVAWTAPVQTVPFLRRGLTFPEREKNQSITSEKDVTFYPILKIFLFFFFKLRNNEEQFWIIHL